MGQPYTTDEVEVLTKCVTAERSRVGFGKRLSNVRIIDTYDNATRENPIFRSTGSLRNKIRRIDGRLS